MAYSPQSFAVGQVLTKAECDQIEINIRDHAHGSGGVSGGNLVTHIVEASSKNTSVISLTSGLDTTVCGLLISSASIGDCVQVNMKTRVLVGSGSSVDLQITLVPTTSGQALFHHDDQNFIEYQTRLSSGQLTQRVLTAWARVQSEGNLTMDLKALTLGAHGSVAANNGQVYGILFRML